MAELFAPFSMRGLTLRNRAVVAPMCQYSAVGGLANDWHFVHLGRFALGGFSLVIVEATGVTPEGRISHADLGLWSNDHIAPLARIVDFLHAQGSAAGIQLAHAGRKGSARLPWNGSGSTGTPEDFAEKGFESWETVSSGDLPHSTLYAAPRALDEAGLEGVREGFAAAALRAEAAGFDVVEVHAAHGYLLNQFLSPLANNRTDAYGGSLENRMRFPLEVIERVRAAWPEHKPLAVRISASDNHKDGWQPADSVVFATALKARGVDLVHCSSGGFEGAAIKPAALYQVPFAEAVRRGAGVPTMAVGLITRPEEAEAILARGEADLIALGRTALDDPNWVQHARRKLETAEPYADWPRPAGYAVRAKDKALEASA